jgi:hypothetical protein
MRECAGSGWYKPPGITLRLLPSILKNALVDLSKMTYTVEQLSVQLFKAFNDTLAEIYWIEQQKMEFKGDAWFEAFVAVNHPLQTHSGDHADLALSDRPASVVAPPDAFPQLLTIVLAVLWKKLVIC